MSPFPASICFKFIFTCPLVCSHIIFSLYYTWLFFVKKNYLFLVKKILYKNYVYMLSGIKFCILSVTICKNAWILLYLKMKVNFMLKFYFTLHVNIIAFLHFLMLILAQFCNMQKNLKLPHILLLLSSIYNVQIYLHYFMLFCTVSSSSTVYQSLLNKYISPALWLYYIARFLCFGIFIWFLNITNLWVDLIGNASNCLGTQQIYQFTTLLSFYLSIFHKVMFDLSMEIWHTHFKSY